MLDISSTSIHWILKKKLLWHPYKTQLKHQIPVRCERPRVVEAGCLLNAINNNLDLLDNIWFSDESHFELTPAVNKQNNRYWAPDQPHIIVERPLHPVTVHVWGAICSYGMTILPINNYNDCKYGSHECLLISLVSQNGFIVLAIAR